MNKLYYTTPFPNAVLQLVPTLGEAELRTLIVIVSKTLGWKAEINRPTQTGRKEIDYIACSQFMRDGRISRRALGIAIQKLIDKDHIVVMSAYGQPLNTPEKRKGKTRMYYRLSPGLMPQCINRTEFLRRRIAALANQKRTTHS